MEWQAWFAVFVVFLCSGLLASNRFAPDLALLAGLTLLLVTGVVSPLEALAGLANEGMVTVGVLYVVVTGIRETGGMDWIVTSVLGRPRSPVGAQLRLMAPVAGMSAFLNNTPVVAIFIPAVQEWAKRHRLSVSKLMLPLSYASIAGGACTLIGTSTNLVVNGLLTSQAGLDGLQMFDLAWLGLPAVVVILVYVVLFGRWLLPERRSALSQFDDPREYTVEMTVDPKSALVGQTIEEAGLRRLPGMYLMEIDRDGRILPAVSPQEALQGEDRLVFVGVVESVVDLQKIRGLEPATRQVFKLESLRRNRSLVEAVVSDSCPLVGKSIREGRFRTTYKAAVIGVSRNGEKIKKKIGDIVLRPGDTLLLEAHRDFVEQQRNSRDFFLVSRLDDSTPPSHERAAVALTILGGMVAAVALGWLSMLKASMLAAGLMVLTRCTTARVARQSVDWQVLIVIAASFGLGNALRSTGAAAAIARQFVGLAGGSPWSALGITYLLTALFTAFATNNAAAVLMFPIAVATAESLGVSLYPFAIVIMMAASASFATPIGYQTNLMVYGPGGYRFVDYLRFGAPLTVAVGITSVGITPFVWPF